VWAVARLRPQAVDAVVLVALLDRFSRDRSVSQLVN
jgi:hypothetical protein